MLKQCPQLPLGTYFSLHTLWDALTDTYHAITETLTAPISGLKKTGAVTLFSLAFLFKTWLWICMLICCWYVYRLFKSMSRNERFSSIYDSRRDAEYSEEAFDEEDEYDDQDDISDNEQDDELPENEPDMDSENTKAPVSNRK
jgi:hypothetical protein